MEIKENNYLEEEKPDKKFFTIKNLTLLFGLFAAIITFYTKFKNEILPDIPMINSLAPQKFAAEIKFTFVDDENSKTLSNIKIIEPSNIIKTDSVHFLLKTNQINEQKELKIILPNGLEKTCYLPINADSLQTHEILISQSNE